MSDDKARLQAASARLKRAVEAIERFAPKEGESNGILDIRAFVAAMDEMKAAVQEHLEATEEYL